MKIAIVGAGVSGLVAAHELSDHPENATIVLESGPGFGGRASGIARVPDDATRLRELLREISNGETVVNSGFVAVWVRFLRSRGVGLRRSAQVERFDVDPDGVDVWVNGSPERFDAVVVGASAADTYALLDRSGLPRPLDERSVDAAMLAEPLFGRVQFAVSPASADDAFAERACRSAHDAVARLAIDHPRITPRYPDHGPASASLPHPNAPAAPRLANRLWRRAHHISALAVAPVAELEFLDLSQRSWPLDEPAVYIGTHRSLFDVPAGVLTLHRLGVFPRLVVSPEHFETPFGKQLKGLGALPALRGTNATATASVAALEAGDSVAFMVEGRPTPRCEAAHAPHGRGAALASLRTNAPIVPIASCGTDLVWPASRHWPQVRRARQKVVIVIGEPFHPETSCVDELMDDMRAILLYLEDLAHAHASGAESPALAVVQ